MESTGYKILGITLVSMFISLIVALCVSCSDQEAREAAEAMHWVDRYRVENTKCPVSWKPELNCFECHTSISPYGLGKL